MSPTWAPPISVIFSTPTTSASRALPAAIAFKPLMDRGRTGGAGVLDPRRRLEAKAGIGLEHQRGREFLANKAAIHRAEIDRVDVGRADTGISERRLGHLDDQRLDVAAFMLAEFAVRPADDAPAHLRPPQLPAADQVSPSVPLYTLS